MERLVKLRQKRHMVRMALYSHTSPLASHTRSSGTHTTLGLFPPTAAIRTSRTGRTPRAKTDGSSRTVALRCMRALRPRGRAKALIDEGGRHCGKSTLLPPKKHHCWRGCHCKTGLAQDRDASTEALHRT